MRDRLHVAHVEVTRGPAPTGVATGPAPLPAATPRTQVDLARFISRVIDSNSGQLDTPRPPIPLLLDSGEQDPISAQGPTPNTAIIRHNRFHSLSFLHTPLNLSVMKIILTGATGNTGSHALRRLLSLPSVTSVVILSRRELTPAPTSPKVTTLILTEAEFLSYPPRVVEALKGASGCVWCVRLAVTVCEQHSSSFAPGRSARFPRGRPRVWRWLSESPSGTRPS